MKHHGYNLKLFVADGKVKVEDLSRIFGVTRQTISLYYGKEKFMSEDLAALDKAGINIPGVNAPGGMSIGDAQMQDTNCLKELELMKLVLASKDQTIRALEMALEARK